MQEGDQRYPALSPDGTQLAYTSNDGTGADLWIANADGTAPRMLFDSGQVDSAPAWSPDGTKLAFEIHGPVVGSEYGDIFVMDMRSGDDGFGSCSRNLGHRAKDRPDMLCNPDRVSVGVRVAPFQGVGQSLHGDSGLVVRLLDTLERPLRAKQQWYDE